MDHEDSSNYSSEPSPAPRSPRTDAPYTAPARKRKFPSVLVVLLLLALITAGVFGWLWYQGNIGATSKESDLTATKQKLNDISAQLKTTTAELKEKSSSSTTTTNTASSSNDTMIKMALAYSRAKVADQGYPSNATDLQGEIDKQSVNFARVQVGSPTAGPGVNIIYFKKVGSDWVLIGDDNGDADRFHTAFGIPNGF